MPNFLQKVWNFLEENPMSFGYRGSGGGGFQVGTNPSWLYLQQRRREMEEEERREEVANRQKLRMTLAQAGVSPETIDRYVPVSTEQPVEYQSIGQLLGVKGRQAEAAGAQQEILQKAREAQQEEEKYQRRRKETWEDYVKAQEYQRRHPQPTARQTGFEFDVSNFLRNLQQQQEIGPQPFIEPRVLEKKAWQQAFEREYGEKPIASIPEFERLYQGYISKLGEGEQVPSRSQYLMQLQAEFGTAPATPPAQAPNPQTLARQAQALAAIQSGSATREEILGALQTERKELEAMGVDVDYLFNLFGSM